MAVFSGVPIIFRMGGVEVPQAPREVGVGVSPFGPFPNEGRVWGSPQKIYRIFC